eukprot:2807241-Prymnesium_polylepis.1
MVLLMVQISCSDFSSLTRSRGSRRADASYSGSCMERGSPTLHVSGEIVHACVRHGVRVWESGSPCLVRQERSRVQSLSVGLHRWAGGLLSPPYTTLAR